MLKAVFRAGPDGRKVILLGVDRENIRRLTGGEPIKVDLTELGAGDGDVIVVYGETLQSLAGELRAAGIPVPPVPPVPR